jgi:hypothetical protein
VGATLSRACVQLSSVSQVATVNIPQLVLRPGAKSSRRKFRKTVLLIRPRRKNRTVSGVLCVA